MVGQVQQAAHVAPNLNKINLAHINPRPSLAEVHARTQQPSLVAAEATAKLYPRVQAPQAAPAQSANSSRGNHLDIKV